MVAPDLCAGTTRADAPSTWMLSASDCALSAVSSAANDTVHVDDAAFAAVAAGDAGVGVVTTGAGLGAAAAGGVAACAAAPVSGADAAAATLSIVAAAAL